MTTITESTETLKAKWLSGIHHAYSRYCRAGWEFIFLLRDGIDTLPRNEQERCSLYEEAYHLTGLSVKTQQNYVSAARKPYATLAMDLGLEIGHLDAVLGLEDEIAEDVLRLAAEQCWTVAQTRKESWQRKQAPDDGKELANAVDDMLSADNKMPWESDTDADAGPVWDMENEYDNEDFVYVPREPLAAVRKIKATFSQEAIAIIASELMSVPY